jgi:hypothetical protein
VTRVANLLGVPAILGGLSMMARFGLSFRTLRPFTASMLEPEDSLATDELVRHQNDAVKGRFGFGIALLGALMQAATCLWPLI